jgi:hypothetical protein
VSSQQEVRPGQLWVDNDPRSKRTRYLRVSEIEGERARCEAWYDEASSLARTVRIKLSRFRPTRSGYRLVEDAKNWEV